MMSQEMGQSKPTTAQERTYSTTQSRCGVSSQHPEQQQQQQGKASWTCSTTPFPLLSEINWDKYASAEPVTIPKLKLNNGLEIPILGLKVSRQTGNDFVTSNAIKFAAKAGFRYFNAAWVDFLDPVIGMALRDLLKEYSGKLSREDFFLTCKAWNTHHTRDMLRLAILDTLDNIGISYADLYMIHWPVAFKENPGTDPWPQDQNGKLLFSDTSYLETYHAMEELVNEGKVKSIGLSNFNISQVQDVLNNCKIKPVVNQIEVHPYLQNDKLVDFCLNNGLNVIAYAPLGANALANLRGLPNLLEDETLIRIGKRYNKTPAQVSIRWCLQRGLVVIPEAITPEQIIEDSQVFDFELSDEDMREIKSLNKNLRFYDAPNIRNHKLYPFNEE